MNNEYEKLSISMRYWLLGRQYNSALKAFEYAKEIHKGKRKDKITPEFEHQIRIAHYLRCFENHLSFPEETLATSFLHDTPEDYNISFEEIGKLFGEKIEKAVEKLTKIRNGSKISNEEYFEEMKRCPIATIVKGADRIHNFQSMVNVFTTNKQISYIEECETFILPLIKNSRRLFPEQEQVYEALKHTLKTQITLIRKIHEADRFNHEETVCIEQHPSSLHIEKIIDQE